MNTVRKDTSGETYRIRVPGRHAWATIVVFGWEATGCDGRPRECGEILIHSDFGSWANSWGHMGVPVKQFLRGLSSDYLASKLMGSEAYTFDGALTVRELRQRLLTWRKVTDLTKDEARALWDYIYNHEGELETSEVDFVNTMQDARHELVCTAQVRSFLQDPWEHIAHSMDRRFQGFWEHVWPEFVSQLRQELAEAEPA